MIVLFGAGGAGRYALSYLRSKGVEPLFFADNNADLWGTTIHGIQVVSPYSVNAPEAEWVACAISRPAATEIRAQLKAMGVKTKPLWECLPVCHGLPPLGVGAELCSLVDDLLSNLMLKDQFRFRRNPHYDAQADPDDVKNIYFPDFIQHKEDEHFVDCGAADGDTVKAFMERWDKWESIIAFEPDHLNYRKLCRVFDPEGRGRITKIGMGVSDFERDESFCASGDYSSHVGEGDSKVRLVTLDHFIGATPPTYIKMDIEGSELEALWGARRILAEHRPVLAVCAYHKSEHLWSIPLLIHAIQPEYKLFFRRYAEGAFELIWYAVPADRWKQ